MELARGNYEEAANLMINPNHIDSDYDDADNYTTRYDMKSPKEKEDLVKLLVNDEKTHAFTNVDDYYVENGCLMQKSTT